MRLWVGGGGDGPPGPPVNSYITCSYIQKMITL